MLLLLGPVTEAHRQLWDDHADEVDCNPTTRPAAWWRFEAGIEEPKRHADAVAFLRSGGHLRPDEIALLDAVPDEADDDI